MTQGVGKCRFCGQVKGLVKSHVVPQALHKDVQPKDAVMTTYSNTRSWGKKSPTGTYDQFLCLDCESHVGQDDPYGIEFVRKYKGGRTGAPLGSFREGFIADIDYAKLKLWVMSMLWRADACSHEFYKGVDLGEKWRRSLTKSIRLRKPGGIDYFAVTATLFDEKDDKEDYGQIITADPHPVSMFDFNWYRFYVYGGFTFFIKVDQRKLPDELARYALRKDEPFTILRRKFSNGEREAFRQLASG